MFGDFSRDSFDPSKHYTRVLMQQGRPLMDADWNEMVELLVREQRELVASLIGWHGTSDNGFGVVQEGANFFLQAGTYYVDGMLCRNCVKFGPLDAARIGLLNGEKAVAYLDVWEESVSAADDANLLEPSMPGSDTATRSRVSWALRATKSKVAAADPSANRLQTLKVLKGDGVKVEYPLLEIRTFNTNTARGQNAACDSSVVNSSAGERIYRIEVHSSAVGQQPSVGVKWSVDNGTTTHSVSEVSGKRLTLAVGGLSNRRLSKPFKLGAWIELFDKRGLPVSKDRNLLKIAAIDAVSITVESDVVLEPEKDILATSLKVHPDKYFIRQWDQPSSTMSIAPVSGSDPNDGWIPLEEGLQIRLLDVGTCIEGDYWLVRVSSGGHVQFSRPRDAKRGNRSVECGEAVRAHHFAPIGKIQFVDNAFTWSAEYRKQFNPKGVPDPDRSCAVSNVAPAVPHSPAVSPAAAEPAVTAQGMCFMPPSVQGPSPVSLLSSEGAKALKGYFASPQDLTRRVFARHLNQKNELQSERYRKYRSALLLSEILETSFERYFAKVDRCLALDYAERPLVEADARADYELAMEFERTLMADDRSKSQLA